MSLAMTFVVLFSTMSFTVNMHYCEGLDSNVSTYEEYKPPLVIRQLYKIDETYLI